MTDAQILKRIAIIGIITLLVIGLPVLGAGLSEKLENLKDQANKEKTLPILRKMLLENPEESSELVEKYTAIIGGEDSPEKILLILRGQWDPEQEGKELGDFPETVIKLAPGPHICDDKVSITAEITNPGHSAKYVMFMLNGAPDEIEIKDADAADKQKRIVEIKDDTKIPIEITGCSNLASKGAVFSLHAYGYIADPKENKDVKPNQGDVRVAIKIMSESEILAEKKACEEYTGKNPIEIDGKEYFYKKEKWYENTLGPWNKEVTALTTINKLDEKCKQAMLEEPAAEDDDKSTARKVFDAGWGVVKKGFPWGITILIAIALYIAYKQRSKGGTIIAGILLLFSPAYKLGAAVAALLWGILKMNEVESKRAGNEKIMKEIETITRASILVDITEKFFEDSEKELDRDKLEEANKLIGELTELLEPDEKNLEAIKKKYDNVKEKIRIMNPSVYLKMLTHIEKQMKEGKKDSEMNELDLEEDVE